MATNIWFWATENIKEIMAGHSDGYFSTAGFSIRNRVDGRSREVGGEILKDAFGVFSERCKA